MSITKLMVNKEPVWEVRFYENGRGSKRLRRRFDRKIDADEFLFQTQKAATERKKNPFHHVSFTERTLATEADYWLRDITLRGSLGHLKRVDGVLKDVLPAYGKWAIEKFTPEFFSRYQQTEKQKGLENSTIDRQVGVLMAILNHSVRNRRIPFNPGLGSRKLARGNPEMQFWNTEEAKGFLSIMNLKYPVGSTDHWVYLVYLLALNTGLRAGEIWGLKPIDISSCGSLLLVRRQFSNLANDFTLTKGKKSRSVPINQTLCDELRSWIKARGIANDATIFQNKMGRPINHDNFADRRFEKDVKTWGGRRIRFHDLRHTATTLLISSGVDIRTVKEICGHSDIKTTMNYIHLVPGNLAKVTQVFSVLPEMDSSSVV